MSAFIHLSCLGEQLWLRQTLAGGCARGFLCGDTTVSVQWLFTTKRDVPPLPSHRAVVVIPPCSGISTC